MSESQPLARVQRLSRLFSRLVLGLATLLLLLDVLLWLDRSALEAAAAALLPAGVPHRITTAALIGGFIAAHLVLGLLLHALWQAHRLFSAFAVGAILTGGTGVRLFRIGLSLVLVLPAQLLASGLTTALLTWGNPPGERSLALSFGSAHVMLAGAGLLILTVGWVMAEAARIAEDNAQIV